VITGIINEYIIYYFSVINSQSELISSIVVSDFITHIYNPYNIDVTNMVPNSILELGSGNYKLSFIPNIVGSWYLQIIHSIYFPWGKNESINIFAISPELGCCVPEIESESFGAINMTIDNNNIRISTKPIIPIMNTSIRV
jgi:hypothetical protein